MPSYIFFLYKKISKKLEATKNLKKKEKEKEKEKRKRKIKDLSYK